MIESLLASLWLFGGGLWLGAALGERRERQRHNASHEEFALLTIKAARSVKDSRRFVGAGTTITQAGLFEIEGLGTFKVVVEDVSEDEPVVEQAA